MEIHFAIYQGHRRFLQVGGYILCMVGNYISSRPIFPRIKGQEAGKAAKFLENVLNLDVQAATKSSIHSGVKHLR